MPDQCPFHAILARMSNTTAWSDAQPENVVALAMGTGNRAAKQHCTLARWQQITMQPTSQRCPLNILLLRHAGVHGRVTDLAQVADRRYNVAMAVVMGKDLDSIIVDTDSTAKQCISYLKEQQSPPMTFLPLSTLMTKPVNDRLRALGGSSKLALDLLTYHPSLERAFLSICG